MAIQVSGVNVIDNDRNLNVGILTATSVDVPPAITTFSPSDGASDVLVGQNVVLTYNTTVSKGSGNITFREGSASGTIILQVAVSSSDVSVSGGQVTIVHSNFPSGKDIYCVVDAGAFTSTALNSETELINTYNFSTGPILTSSFSPSDSATDVSISTNIVITFNTNIAKGSGNITIRSGSASGTVQQTIDVTSGAVSVSGTQATINPPSDLTIDEIDTYVVVDAGCFTNTDGDAASANAIINTYNFTTEDAFPALGAEGEGGTLICMSGGIYWIVAPACTLLRTTWYNRCAAITTANAHAACGDWFIPSCGQLENPGRVCCQWWDRCPSYNGGYLGSAFWSNQSYNSCCAYRVYFNGAGTRCHNKQHTSTEVRAFRCVSY